MAPLTVLAKIDLKFGREMAAVLATQKFKYMEIGRAHV